MPFAPVIVELNRLRAAGLIDDYAIGGSIGAQQYITPMATEDIDVFVVLTGPHANSLAPLRDVYADLTSRGVEEKGAHLVIGGWPVQFLPGTKPLYQDAIVHARPRVFEGETGQVMSPEHLAAIALDTGRGKDKLRLIEFMNNGVLDMRAFEDLIQKFGLTDKWNSFQSNFLTTR
jgi:hypothetical protein